MLYCKPQSVINRWFGVLCEQGALEAGGARTIAEVIEALEQGSTAATDGWNQMALHLRRIAGMLLRFCIIRLFGSSNSAGCRIAQVHSTRSSFNLNAPFE